MVAAIYICLLLLEVGVLIIRLAMPMQRKWPTVMLNIIILLLFPLGTAARGIWAVEGGSGRVRIAECARSVTVALGDVVECKT
jgi:hypothetical protein